MKKVALRQCDDYLPENVLQAVEDLLEPLGGMECFVKPGQNVLLKPNMLAAKAPEAAVTTHPAVVEAVAVLVKRAGGNVFVGDSPGIGSVLSVAKKSGILDVVERTGAKLLQFERTRAVTGGGIFKMIELAEDYLDADVIINLPKLKTHEMMTFTCGVKNLYGTVVGPAKAGLHLTAGRSKEMFAGLLLEIAGARKVDLTIVDAITAMEGNGPNSGTPRQVGMLLAGDSPVAVDVIGAGLAGIPVDILPVEQEAVKRGIDGALAEQIEIVGERVEPVYPPFKLPDGLDVQFGLPGFVKNALRRYLTPLPAADVQKCRLCGICRDACPPSAITINKNALKVDSGRCIRCWCCRELCPYHALEVRRSLLLRAVSRIKG